MKKGVLFGAGVIGRRALQKLSGLYDLIGFSDNDSRLWGKDYCGLKVMKPEELLSIDGVIIICSDYYSEIYEQLKSMGIQDVLGVDPYTYQLFTIDQNKMMYPVMKGGQGEIRKVLFIQMMPCIRTFKIAYVLAQKGIKVGLAYQVEISNNLQEMFPDLFDEIYPVQSFSAFVDYLNHSDYDILHCSNEPDILTNIALCSNKCVVHDTHDMTSMEVAADSAVQALEYVANSKSSGAIYYSQAVRDYAVKRFEIGVPKTMVLMNLPLEKMHPKKYLERLSRKDGQIHCVYEGNMSDQPERSRYLKDIWDKIISYGIHVHFYTGFSEDYCKKISEGNPYLHYEGSRTAEELAVLNTQYDCGLLVVNITKSNRNFINTTMPNKLFEYINSGIPVVASDLEIFRGFFDAHDVGGCLDMHGNIKEQLEKLIRIDVDRDYLKKNGMTMDAKADHIIQFYQGLSRK